jgi:hypothetical protein
MEVDMAHFKRKRPKSRRAGCLLCKPHKANGMKDSVHALKPRDRREKERLDDQEADAAERERGERHFRSEAR